MIILTRWLRIIIPAHFLDVVRQRTRTSVRLRSSLLSQPVNWHSALFNKVVLGLGIVVFAPCPSALAQVVAKRPPVSLIQSTTMAAPENPRNAVQFQQALSGIYRRAVALDGRVVAMIRENKTRAVRYAKHIDMAEKGQQVGFSLDKAGMQIEGMAGHVRDLQRMRGDVRGYMDDANAVLDDVYASVALNAAQRQPLEGSVAQILGVTQKSLGRIKSEIDLNVPFVAAERAELWHLSGGRESGQPLIDIILRAPAPDYEADVRAAIESVLVGDAHARFEVVALASAKGNAAMLEIQRAKVRSHAKNVMQILRYMDVVDSNLALSEAHSKGIAANRVQVFVR